MIGIYCLLILVSVSMWITRGVHKNAVHKIFDCIPFIGTLGKNFHNTDLDLVLYMVYANRKRRKFLRLACEMMDMTETLANQCEEDFYRTFEENIKWATALRSKKLQRVENRRVADAQDETDRTRKFE